MKQSHRFATVALAAVVGTGLAGEGAAMAAVPPEPTVASAPAAPAAQQVAIYQYATGVVISRHRLAIRTRPTMRSKRVGFLRPGQRFKIKCWTRGQRVRHTRVWYRLGYSSPKNYVSGAYVRVIKGRVRHC
ncbi:hypothetical protein AB0C21_25495 [Spirillospora sp. NPDC049024]|uniref:hypothetical protein n=1 Tax=unclassified Actinomadura TaxID=2626254 RepID=UPI0011ED23B8|nr:hypothetical protein [Actinomadura sp. K4S16]